MSRGGNLLTPEQRPGEARAVEACMHLTLDLCLSLASRADHESPVVRTSNVEALHHPLLLLQL